MGIRKRIFLSTIAFLFVAAPGFIASNQRVAKIVFPAEGIWMRVGETKPSGVQVFDTNGREIRPIPRLTYSIQYAPGGQTNTITIKESSDSIKGELTGTATVFASSGNIISNKTLVLVLPPAPSPSPTLIKARN